MGRVDAISQVDFEQVVSYFVVPSRPVQIWNGDLLFLERLSANGQKKS